MSLWEDLGDFLGEAKDVTTSGIALSWDLATAPVAANPFVGDQAAHAEDMRADLGEAWSNIYGAGRTSWDTGANVLGKVFELPVLKQGAQGMYWTYSNFVSQPIATTSMYISDQSPTRGDLGASWNAAENISPGQALIANASGPLQDLAWNVAGEDERAWLTENMPWINPDFNITEEAQRQAAFEDAWIGKSLSGAADVGVAWYIDPTKGAGRAGSALYRAASTTTIKGGGDLLKLAEDATKHEEFLSSGGTSGAKTGFGQFVEDSTTLSAAQLSVDKRVLQSSKPELLASLLGNSSDYKTNALIIRAAAGDLSARSALREASASNWDAIVNAQNGLEATQARILETLGGRENLFDDAGNMRFDWDYENLPGLANDIDLYSHYKSIHDDLIEQDSWLAKTVELANEPTITQLRTRGVKVQEWRTAATISRADRKMTKTGFWSDKTYQGSAFTRPIRMIQWLGDETPSGWVNIKGTSANGSAKEIMAALSKVKAWGDEAGAVNKARWIDEYLNATTQQERMQVLLAMEKAVLYDVGRKYLGEGANIKAFIDDTYSHHARGRTTAAQHLSTRGFLVDSDGTLIKAPQFEAQLADSMPLADFAVYEDLLRRHGSVLRETTGKLRDTAHEAYDIFAAVWRPLTLLRLGYTQRNVTEGWLRSAAYFDGMMNVDPLLLGRNSAAFRFGQNMGNRMTAAQFRLFRGRAKTREILDEAELLRGQHNSLKSQLDDLVEDEAVLVRGYKKAAGPAAMKRDDYYAGMVDPLQPTLQPKQITRKDVELGVASPSASTLGVRQRERYFELQARGENLTRAERAEFAGLARKATARWANAQKKSGYRLAYRDADGTMRYADKVSDIPDSAFDPALAARASRKLDDRNVRRVSRDQEPVVEPLLDPEVHLVPRHSRLVKEAQGREEIVPASVLEDYPRLAKTNPEDQYIYRNSAELQSLRDDITAQMNQIDLEIQALTERARLVARRGKKGTGPVIKRGGQGTFTHGGQELPDAFSGPEGLGASIAASANPRMPFDMAGPMSFIARKYDAQGAWVRVNPTDPTYWDSLSRVANRQFRNSEMVRRIIAGEDPAAIASWLARDRHAKGVLKAAGVDPEDAYNHVQNVADMINRYIPDRNMQLRMLDEEVSALELKAAMGGRDDLAPIHGQEAARYTGFGNIGRGWQKATQTGFKFLGSIPEDVAVRHPFYRKVYQTELKRQVNIRSAQVGDLSQAELEHLVKAAHARALKETKETLYTIERFSNAAAKMRFMMPFFASWENSMRTWLGLTKRNASVVPSAVIAWYAPNRAGWVFDENGDQVGLGEDAKGGEFIVMQVPTKGMPDWMAKGIEPMNNVSIPKQSLNLILQGDAWFQPGTGPIVQIPVSEIAKQKPSFGTMMQNLKILPYGPSEKTFSWDLALPAWAKRLQSRLSGESDVTYANAMASMMATERIRYRLGERDTKPTPDEIKERTNRFFEIRMAANLVLPFSPSFRSPYQMYIDEYRRMRAEDSATADERFLEQYPEYYEAIMSLSKNPSGVWATDAAVSRSKKYSGLVAGLGELDPSLIGLVTNEGNYNPEAFSDSAYTYQFTHTLGPGSTQDFRETQSPNEAVKSVDIQRGWIEYMKLSNMVEATLAARGLTSLQQAGAEDLATVKSQWVQAQADENSAWWYDYNERDAAQYAKNVQGLTAIVSDDQFMADNGDDPKWMAVQDYLEFRGLVAAELARRDAAGGSADITAVANQDLAGVVAAYTTELSATSTEFADIYTRYLERDTFGVVPND